MSNYPDNFNAARFAATIGSTAPDDLPPTRDDIEAWAKEAAAWIAAQMQQKWRQSVFVYHCTGGFDAEQFQGIVADTLLDCLPYEELDD